jgi:PPOX class probable F420-dependent enzyme
MTEIPDGYDDLLTRPLIGHLGTTRTDGAPSVTPMWFAWDGEVLRFTHTTYRKKLANIEAQPFIALSVVDPDSPYRYLQARAKVESVEADPTGAFYQELARRYGQSDPPPPKDAVDRVIVTARPFAYSKQ